MAVETASISTTPEVVRPWMRLWWWLTEPPDWMTDLDRRRKSRLLATMALPFILIVLLSLFVIADSPTYPKWLAVSLLGFFSLINVLSRTRYYSVAALMMVLVFTALPYYQMIVSGGVAQGDHIVWGICGVLTANFLLSWRATLLTVAVAIGFPLFMVVTTEEAIFTAYSRDLFIIACASALILTFSRQRDLIEADRQRELKKLNTALEASAREAREANRLKDLFLATMSHELRTPLNAIIGYLGLILFTGKLDPDNNHMAARSLANAERLLSLINNVLDLSRIAAGRLEITPANLSVRKLADAMRPDLELQVKDKGLDLNFTVSGTLPETIYHDEERLTQIVSNLIGNAVKFTEQGHIDVLFGGSGDRLVIEVRDTGIGIPPAKQNLIFDEFMQADTGYARKFGGAGLGLAIVKRLVILMNGSIKVTSDVGQGSIFTVELPMHLPKVVKGTGPLRERVLA